MSRLMAARGRKWRRRKLKGRTDPVLVEEDAVMEPGAETWEKGYILTDFFFGEILCALRPLPLISWNL